MCAFRGLFGVQRLKHGGGGGRKCGGLNGGRELGSVAAFGPTMSLGLTEYISVAAVTATYGSALTAGHFGKAPK